MDFDDPQRLDEWDQKMEFSHSIPKLPASPMQFNLPLKLSSHRNPLSIEL